MRPRWAQYGEAPLRWEPLGWEPLQSHAPAGLRCYLASCPGLPGSLPQLPHPGAGMRSKPTPAAHFSGEAMPHTMGPRLKISSIMGCGPGASLPQAVTL